MASGLHIHDLLQDFPAFDLFENEIYSFYMLLLHVVCFSVIIS